MQSHRFLVPALFRAGVTLAAALALLAGAAPQPAAATSLAASPVELGVHRFGHLRPPDTVVAHADPDEVGFSRPPKGADGVDLGPWSFDVAKDGSIWLLDEVNHRLLTWPPGALDHPARTLALPGDPLDRVADFAVAPDHTIYVTYWPPPGPGPKTMRLAALAPEGTVRWTAPTIDEIFNAQLRIGPDNALYVDDGQSADTWTPLTTPAGRPLPLAEQRRQTSSQQPLPGGLRLTSTYIGPRECRFTLTNQAGQTLRGWRVTSQTDLGLQGVTPALVGGDPVVVLGISQQTKAEFLYEAEVLRLARVGGTSVRFAISPDTRVVWGDTPITGVRVGPDGQLYQLRTSPTSGVDIVRWPLAPAHPAPTPTTAPAPPAPTGHGDGLAATPTPPPTQPSAPTPVAAPVPVPATTDSAARQWLPPLAGITAATAAGLAMWLLYRRRHRGDLIAHGGSRPTT
jgi:hypothetical protein